MYGITYQLNRRNKDHLVSIVFKCFVDHLAGRFLVNPKTIPGLRVKQNGFHHRGQVSALARTATAFGIIWSVLVIASGMIYNVGMETVAALYGQSPEQAATVWLAIDSVFNGLGGGVEVVGGVWVLLLSIAGLRNGGLPRLFNYFGFVVGAAGLITVAPALSEIGGMVFGLTQIIWFTWLGIAMLRQPRPQVQKIGQPAFE